MVKTDGVPSILSRKGFVGKMVKKPKLPPKPSIDDYLIATNISSKEVGGDRSAYERSALPWIGVDRRSTATRYASQGHVRVKHRNYLRTEKRGVVDSRSVNEWETQRLHTTKRRHLFASLKSTWRRKCDERAALALLRVLRSVG
jgi:hypothetical protein